MSGKPVVITRTCDGRCEVDVPSVPGWDGFDKLVEFLKREYGAKVISAIDGPDSRRWDLSVYGRVLIVKYDDPYGNTIESKGPESAKTVEVIGKDLEVRLRGF